MHGGAFAASTTVFKAVTISRIVSRLATWRTGCGLILDHNFAVRVLQTVHQHRAHQHAVVGDGAHGHDHLQRRDGDALAHRDLRDGNLAPVR